jgi:hypothetical protein
VLGKVTLVLVQKDVLPQPGGDGEARVSDEPSHLSCNY